MKNKLWKRIICIILSFGLMFFELVEVQASGTVREDFDRREIVGSISLEDYGESFDSSAEIMACLEGKGIQISQPIKTKVDLCQSESLPLIGNQIGKSCGSFSSIYYQYSYEINRMLGVDSAENAKIFSPYYALSYFNESGNIASKSTKPGGF